MYEVLRKVDRAVAKFEYLLLTFLVAALTIILSAQVVLRYFFNSPLFWAEEISVQALIAASFIGVSYLLYDSKLVRVDALLGLFRQPGLDRLLTVLNLVSLVTLLVLCYVSTVWILRPEIRADISPTTQLPRWYNYAILVLSFYGMAWHQLVKFIGTARSFRTQQHEEPAS
ncbi:MAG: TRAP transporter small permease subunit [Thiothrix sp.]|nr:TRAP transporter small permease subunit [Thiothrix sp.]HPE59835.1 TRAP transporter small permease subunit [Thiolinea sp.]